MASDTKGTMKLIAPAEDIGNGSVIDNRKALQGSTDVKRHSSAAGRAKVLQRKLSDIF